MKSDGRENMSFLPISINITNKQILIIGGGRIASHKIKFIEPFTSNIKVVATEVLDDIKQKGYEYVEKPYDVSDLNDAFLIYACTNIIELNKQVKADAERLGKLCCVVDNPPLCDFVAPAIYKRGAYTVACGSNAQDVYKSVEIRNKIKEYFEHDSSVFDNAQYAHL
jgi:precorrin-2 dehydrogenase / sirohydrochlorin ferrochelatase